MEQLRQGHNHQRGFTLIEIVVVLIIMAIFIATVAIPYTSLKFVTTDLDLPNEREILKSSLCFAQIKALNDAVDNNTWGISFTSGGSSYTLVYNGGTPTPPVNLPGECGSNPLVCISTPTHNLPSGMTITGSTVSFNKWGSPVDNGGNPLTTNINIVLTKAGSPPIQPINVTVTKNTGYFLIQ
jgi:prepilin-type N-terminal cleavage/methylation domain-containing protein